MLGSYFSIVGIFFDKMHLIYLYLGSFKWILEYHKVYFINETSGIIHNMKIAQRNKCEKQKIVNLNTSLIQIAIKSQWTSILLYTTRSIEIRGSQNSRSDFRSMMTWQSKVSFTKLLEDIKELSYSHHHIQRLT